MTGAELTAVWLAGIVFTTAAVRGSVKAWAAARVEVAKVHAQAHVDAYQVVARVQAQADPLYVPPVWPRQEGL